MELSRRHFLKNASAAALALSAFRNLPAHAQVYEIDTINGIDKFGKLIADPDGLLDLPAGFNYKIISRSGDRMSDGLITPFDPDGMAAFPVKGKPNHSLLIRNHEQHSAFIKSDAFNHDEELANKLAGTKAYDRYKGKLPANGGTTNLLSNQKTGLIEHSFLSLVGTVNNCCGGATPWGSWLTCEETLDGPDQGFGKQHGFVFEVPSTATGLIEAVPLKDMGRFRHEACAVDITNGIVYMTEDYERGLFYRFIPNKPDTLLAGGKLQALAIIDQTAKNTRNWPEDIAQNESFITPVKFSMTCKWIDLDDVTSPHGDLSARGEIKGAAIFARSEGLSFTLRKNKQRELFFAATTGGREKIGQLWRYQPSPFEGTKREQEQPGQLELFYETSNRAVLEAPDNLAIAPWGDLIICEDSYSTAKDDFNYLRGITPEGKIYTLGKNPQKEKGEFCGACFSPDGSTMFVNIQTPGMTFAISGPWGKLGK